MSKSPKLLAVSGVKNSGKTTLIDRLLPYLTELGIKTAVIKHDGHVFTPDTPGTDSYRFFSAGACGSAVFDGEKFSLTRRASVSESELSELFPDADLILLEGFKGSDYPKLELIRRGISAAPVCDPKTCLALISDLGLEAGLPVFHPDAYSDIAKFIESFIKTD
jgi:molybdopterin-guanine dinucleotide biosynthesis adapter protein